jgi:CHAT domain-containing protein
LAIGDPDLKDPRFDIPFTVTEVNSIASFFPDSKVLIKSQATKSAFKSLAASYDILHLACHGIFDANKPMDSSLLLTPSIMDDGRLTTSEIFDLEFNAGLVTLSACSSGMSRIRAGDETIGLPRAFIYAGIPSIVASLWNVNDESTALLMKKFYSNLKTLSKAEALQQAQLSLLKDKKYASPYFWAAFYLIGEET